MPILLYLILLVTFSSCSVFKPAEGSIDKEDLYVFKNNEQKKLKKDDLLVDINNIVSLSETSYPNELIKNYFLPAIKAHSSRINVIEEVPFSSKIYTGGQDGNIFEVNYDSQNGGFLKINLLAKGSRPINSLAISPDGKFLAVSQFSLVSIINLEKKSLEAQFRRVKGRILSMLWDMNNTMLLLGRANGDIFSWNIGSEVSKASNSTNSLEFYETNPSPVVKMVFHPSGRAFFAALQGGSVYMIRLVRTERELGLRLDSNKSGMKQGRYVVRIGRTPSMINDMLIDKVTDQLLVSASDGGIYRWKLRGIRKTSPIMVGSDSTGLMSLIHFSDINYKLGLDASVNQDTVANQSIISTLGRNLKIRLWCTNDEVYEVIEPTSSVIKLTEDNSSNSEISIKSAEDDILEQLKKDILKETSLSNEVAVAQDSSLPKGLIAETPRFFETLIAGRFSSESGILWLGDKTGALVGFDIRGYVSSDNTKSLILNVCKGKK